MQNLKHKLINIQAYGQNLTLISFISVSFLLVMWLVTTNSAISTLACIEFLLTYTFNIYSRKCKWPQITCKCFSFIPVLRVSYTVVYVCRPTSCVPPAVNVSAVETMTTAQKCVPMRRRSTSRTSESVEFDTVHQTVSALGTHSALIGEYFADLQTL